MKSCHFILGLALFCLVGCLLPNVSRASQLSEETIGVGSLDYLETLPLMRDLVICREASSHDKKGGNDNGFSNKAEWVRRDSGPSAVILDVAGPGSLKSFWYSWINDPHYPKALDKFMAWQVGKGRFFFNDDKKPGLAVPLSRMIGTAPQAYPLALPAEDSTGGYITYVPINYQDGLRITVDGAGLPMFFYHFWYHTYPKGTKVTEWKGDEDLSPILRLWDPEFAIQPAAGLSKEFQNLTVQPGLSSKLLSLEKGGRVMCIRMKLPENERALRTTWLKAFWDRDDRPSMEAPLSLLFAVQNRFAQDPKAKKESVRLKGLVAGQDRQGMYYFRLPMPFKESAVLSLENRGESPVAIEKIIIEYDQKVLKGLGRDAGYLKTQHRKSRDLTPGRDYLLAELQGRGHIVGSVMAVEDASVNFLEGDERIYTDGGRSPLVIGDATETYFNGSWYFCDHAFSCPLHGAPTFNHLSGKLNLSTVSITMYRFHLSDMVPFRSRARFSIQHGPYNNVPGNYESLVFYYGIDEPGLASTDHLRLSDDQDLKTHDYKGAEPVMRVEKSGFFEGEFNGMDLGTLRKPEGVLPVNWMYWLMLKQVIYQPPDDSPDRVTFIAMEHQKPYEFTVNIRPDSQAVMLRRVFDQSIFDQKAEVMVDGYPAGTWFNTGNNKWKIWAEDDLILDPSTTRGKSSITIKIVPKSQVFSDVEYSVFSIVAPN